jgi:hypothetical protein
MPTIEVLSYCMEESASSESNSRLAGQEDPRCLFNPKVHCRVHNGPQMDLILSHVNPGHIFTLYFLKIIFNIILVSTAMAG